MNPREKLLAGLMGLVVVGWGGYWFLQHKILQPLKAKDQELVSLEFKLDNTQKSLLQARDAEFDINKWRSLALPGNESTAQSLYAQYLDKLLTSAGIDKPNISQPTKRPYGLDYTRHNFTVTARMDLGQLTKFLVSFYKSDVMHQIRRLDIKPEIEKDRLKDFNVTLAIDAVAMRDAEAKSDMPKPSNPAYKNSFAERKPEEFSLFGSKNPFQPTKLVSQSIARTEPRRTDERDERGNYTMTGVVVSDGTPQLWLTDKMNKKKLFLSVGDDVKIPGFSAKLVDINSREALLQVANDIGSVRIGKTLATWTKLPQTAAAKP